MAPAVAPNEPKPSTKPEPIGDMAWISLITICTLCGLFILWRRADALRRVVSRRLKLKTMGDSEGRIRLSEDDGPSATEFLEDDFDEDNAHLDLHADSNDISAQMKRMTNAWREPNIAALQAHTNGTSSSTPLAQPSGALGDHANDDPIIRL